MVWDKVEKDVNLLKMYVLILTAKLFQDLLVDMMKLGDSDQGSGRRRPSPLLACYGKFYSIFALFFTNNNLSYSFGYFVV